MRLAASHTCPGEYWPLLADREAASELDLEEDTIQPYKYRRNSLLARRLKRHLAVP